MALAQTELAIEQLEAASPAGARRAIHETRKAIKRIRTILRLLEDQLGPQACRREQRILGDAAATLAGARDAEVMLATFEGLLKDNPRLAGRRRVRRLRARLAAERDRAELRAIDPVARAAAIAALRGFRARAAGWQLAEGRGITPIEPGLRRIYREGRRRLRRAARGKRGDMRAMHQWRKRVKDLRYAGEALERRELPRRASGRRGREEARRLRRLAKRADELGELLGEEHDLAVFGQWLREERARTGLKPKTRRELEGLIDRRRAKLRRRALREGRSLYERTPGRFASRIGRIAERTGPKLS